MPVILASQEAEIIKRLSVESQSRQIICQTPAQHTKKVAGRVAQVVEHLPN
jgi:hypothetical protein